VTLTACRLLFSRPEEISQGETNWTEHRSEKFEKEIELIFEIEFHKGKGHQAEASHNCQGSYVRSCRRSAPLRLTLE
jgi:hypothetical protein